METTRNVNLIGMPYAGKSTLGVLLAKTLAVPFLDTDIYIQAMEKRSLKEIIQDQGMQRFKKLEESYILSLTCQGHVIATGGSVVYSSRAMKHLRDRGITLFLEISLPLLIQRVRDMDERGIVRGPGQSLELLFEERKSLYEMHADLRFLCDGKGHEQIIEEIVDLLKAS